MQQHPALVLAILSLAAGAASYAATGVKLLMHAARAPAAAMVLAEPGTTPRSAQPLLEGFLKHFDGHFDNHEQVATNEEAGLTPRHGGGHEHIHCVVRPVTVLGADAGSAHAIATYYFNGDPSSVFRERLYTFEMLQADKQFGACVRMSIYKLRDSVSARVLADGDVEDIGLSAACDLSDELHVPEADVFWRWAGERFEGHMRTEGITIVSERSGREIIVRDDVQLWADALWVNDRGHDAETGDYVYGNVHGIPYKMSRVPADHWSATGRPAPSDSE